MERTHPERTGRRARWRKPPFTVPSPASTIALLGNFLEVVFYIQYMLLLAVLPSELLLRSRVGALPLFVTFLVKKAQPEKLY